MVRSCEVSDYSATLAGRRIKLEQIAAPRCYSIYPFRHGVEFLPAMRCRSRCAGTPMPLCCTVSVCCVCPSRCLRLAHVGGPSCEEPIFADGEPPLLLCLLHLMSFSAHELQAHVPMRTALPPAGIAETSKMNLGSGATVEAVPPQDGRSVRKRGVSGRHRHRV